MNYPQKVSLFIIGFQKADTRALRSFLNDDPRIDASRLQELHYFDRPGRMTLDQYHGHYIKETAEIWLDSTPIYIFWKNCLAQIRDYTPEAKLILSLRDPVDRAYSQWVMEIAKGNDNRSFEEIIDTDTYQNIFENQDGVKSILARGFYAQQIERLLAIFPAEQCLFIDQHILRNDHHRQMSEIYDFIGLNNPRTSNHQIVHTYPHEPLNGKIREKLTALYRDDAKRVRELTGLPLQSWQCFD